MSLYRNTLDLLQSAGVHPQKRLGQNFIIDQNVFDLIVETVELSSEDAVLELGAGIGILTQRLALLSGKVIAVELDKGLFHILQSNCRDIANVVPIQADMLDLNFSALLAETVATQFSNIKIIGNLPYYITTPILMKILNESSVLPIRMILVMVQEEVGMRIVASPGSKDYGALSIAIGYRAHTVIVKRIPKGCFYPQPKVDSVLVKLNMRDKPPVYVKDENLFFKIIRGAFQHRRKTLRNALLLTNQSGELRLSMDSIDSAMQSLSLNPRRRGETLNIAEFAELANAIYDSK